MANSNAEALPPTLPEQTRLKIVYRNIDDLIPYAGNARTHTQKQITQISASIKNFGFSNPVLVDSNGGIIAGHGRVSAAKQLGMKEMPTIELGHLSAEERRAYIIADNRLAELAGWDRDILKIEFQALSELDLDFDLEITGFETAELDILLDEDIDAVNDPADEAPEPVDGTVVSKLGDVWILGSHRLICGEAREAAVYERLMGDELARAVFTDPPYNVKIDGHVCGSGSVKHRVGKHPDAWRLPAEQVESLLAELIERHLARPNAAIAMTEGLTAAEIAETTKRLQNAGDTTVSLALIERVDLTPGSLKVRLNKEMLAENIAIKPEQINPTAVTILSPFQRRRRGVELKLHIGEPPAEIDRTLVQNIVKARSWLSMIFVGKTFSEIADIEGVSKRRVQDVVNLAFLSPDILDRIALGEQPDGLTTDYLIKTRFPAVWSEQREQFATI